MTGLTRVRRFQQDDAHIFCRPDQIKSEVASWAAESCEREDFLSKMDPLEVRIRLNQAILGWNQV